jgi:two-component sensor histidine kinase
MGPVSSTATRTLLIWVLIATISGLAAILAWRWTVTTADNATHTLLVRQQLSTWLIAAQDLENRERGYLLTRDESYLRQYQSAKDAVGKIHESLTSLVAGNPEQLEKVDAINVTLRERVALIDQAIADFKSGQASSETLVAESERGRQVMGRLRGMIADAKEQEETLFREHVEQFRSQSFWLLVAVIATLVASAALAVMAIVRERQRIAALEVSSIALASTNRMLEQRVKERTEELAVERDRAKAERERAEALLRDVTHRIGNTLALAAGFINLHVRHTSDPLALKTLTGARDRIHAIASAQRRINVTNDLDLVRVDTLIPAVMADLVGTASENRIKLTVDVPPLLAAAQVATSLCVLTQEFVVNSLKHAFEDDETGHIKVCLKANGTKGAELVVEDDGAGLPDSLAPDENSSTDAEGLGAKIAALLTRQFGGEIVYEPAKAGSRRPGTRVTVRLAELKLTPPEKETVSVVEERRLH